MIILIFSTQITFYMHKLKIKENIKCINRNMHCRMSNAIDLNSNIEDLTGATQDIENDHISDNAKTDPVFHSP